MLFFRIIAILVLILGICGFIKGYKKDDDVQSACCLFISVIAFIMIAVLFWDFY